MGRLKNLMCMQTASFLNLGGKLLCFLKTVGRQITRTDTLIDVEQSGLAEPNQGEPNRTEPNRNQVRILANTSRTEQSLPMFGSCSVRVRCGSV